jgi:hypothetical protein
MGHIFASIELSNPRKPELRPMSIRALVDTGALMLCLPEHIALQLDLQTESLREVTVADGQCPVCGPREGVVREQDMFCRRAGSGG